MRYLALATDYDDTLANRSKVAPAVLEAMHRLRASGRKLFLVTGRRLDDLLSVFTPTEMFESVVAENGAVLFDPRSATRKALAQPPPEALLSALTKASVPFVAGDIMIATWLPHEAKVRAAIAEAGTPHGIVLNKSNLMILPSGTTKATGLRVALEHAGISAKAVVGVGDAENDVDLLRFCGLPVAVANALPCLKQAATMVLSRENGDGISELIDHLLATDTESSQC